MYTLGINSVYHESAACLMHGAKILAFAEEERFNRRKHGKPPRPDNADSLPLHAMHYCFSVADIDITQVDYIGYSSDPQVRVDHHTDSDPGFVENIRQAPLQLRNLGFRGEFAWVDHHMSHAASAFYASPFAEAAVLTIDGIGDACTTSSHHGVDHRLKWVQDVSAPHSIGFLWELVSMFLGFDIYDATKIMGLAAYGDPNRFLDQFREIAILRPAGQFEIRQDVVSFQDLDYATPSGYFAGLETLFQTPKRQPDQELTQVYKDISAALQQVTDELLLHMVRHLHESTGSENLCMAGGVALNCVSNQRILEQGPFQQLYIQPAAHDAGTAVGCAYYIWHQLLGNPRGEPMWSPYWGPEFSNDEIEKALREGGFKYRKSEDIEAEVAQLISESNVIGYFQGRMEVGPRALGNRSLLADPRRPNMRDILNVKVKHREFFRPFAPSVLYEQADQWFQIEKKTSASEFMLMAYPAHPHQQEKIPSVIHADGTSRVQTVRPETNPRYHRLISEFHRLTGVPIVLNTSFNDSEPIVCTPQDALFTFMKTRIDYLAIGDFLLAKTDNPGPPPAPIEPPPAPMQRVNPALANHFHQAIANHRLTNFHGMQLLTDLAESPAYDRVLPLFVEQQFFFDELDSSNLRDAQTLEIGVGSAALSIGVAQAGAAWVTALESNPRAVTFAGFNVMLNGCEDRIEIREAGISVYQPVEERRFDFIFGNPLFIPDLTGESPLQPRSARIYGLGMAEEIFRGLDQQLTDGGKAQFVLSAPGDAHEPFLLKELAAKHLAGATTIRVHPEPDEYVWTLRWLCDIGLVTVEQGEELLRQAQQDGVTHLHLCVVQYAPQGAQQVTLSPSTKTYPNRFSPLLGLEQRERQSTLPRES